MHRKRTINTVNQKYGDGEKKKEELKEDKKNKNTKNNHISTNDTSASRAWKLKFNQQDCNDVYKEINKDTNNSEKVIEIANDISYSSHNAKCNINKEGLCNLTEVDIDMSKRIIIKIDEH